eukprot:TRINITY_DN6369_c0_g1_i1.p1 TRINITY_DN6369_c0_g1~~TRINITY_DN6369_c0_g1_i1.p1  ORF type:complete len:342 (+),score=59.33 TRINITY_DN6369_c0_g1_i1:1464-2489(+)
MSFSLSKHVSTGFLFSLSPVESTCGFCDLDDDVVIHIMSLLDAVDVRRLSRVCTGLHTLASNAELWHGLCLRDGACAETDSCHDVNWRRMHDMWTAKRIATQVCQGTRHSSELLRLLAAGVLDPNAMIGVHTLLCLFLSAHRLEQGHDTAVAALLEAGASLTPTPHSMVSFTGCTNELLTQACSSQCIDCVRVLLAHGAKVTPSHLHSLGSGGFDRELLKLFLASGANVNARQDFQSWTLLHQAAFHTRVTVLLDILLQHPKIELNARDAAQRTPLLMACRQRNWRAVAALLRAGADPNIRTQDGVATAAELLYENRDLLGCDASSEYLLGWLRSHPQNSR